ncbi:MAG TPA: iron-sulfur cluster assembly protein, partial [Caldisericia bacterium]|nr:iron-sulfur cluster assembly protein [Caldisericia bacterium]
MEEKDVLKILEEVVDPELNRNIVELNMIKDIVFNDDKISLKFLLTTESCPLKEELKNNIVQALKKNGFKEVQINLETMKNDDLKKISSSLKKEKSNKEKIRNIIAVASGKGGVGKSTITS